MEATKSWQTQIGNQIQNMYCAMIVLIEFATRIIIRRIRASSKKERSRTELLT